jgi:hypothetical protein
LLSGSEIDPKAKKWLVTVGARFKLKNNGLDAVKAKDDAQVASGLGPIGEEMVGPARLWLIVDMGHHTKNATNNLNKPN